MIGFDVIFFCPTFATNCKAMIKHEDIVKILEAAQIADVVGAFVPLKKRGANYIGLCPFHNEKTPSFNVNPARGIFKCFGCGEGGDSVAFLMKHEHYTYPEALRWLAERYHIHIEETEATPEEKAAQSERDRVFHVNEFAQKYFQNLLFNDEQGRSTGLSYFEERCLREDTIRKWGLGYCKDSWDDFCTAAKAEGFSEEDMVAAGVAIKNENTGKVYDRFRGRVTFPIYNVGGRVLGFSARILTSDKTKAKYVNSPESIIYTKGKVLFGLHLAKDAIVKEDLCYLVEGNMDAVMMYQNGVKNVVATSGTALTEQQTSMIKRYTRNVTVLYDGDSAGIKATFKAVNIFLEHGLNVRTVLFPDGEDPDSFARKHTMDEFQTFLKENSQNFIIYKTNLLQKQAENDPIKRADLIRDIVHTISLVPDLLERNTYLQECSSILQTSEEVLGKALKKQLFLNRDKKNKQEDPQPAIAEQVILDTPKAEKQEIELNPDYAQEKAIIEILFKYGNTMTRQEVFGENDALEYKDVLTAAYVVCDIVNDDIRFTDVLFGKIFELYRHSIYEENTVPAIDSFISNEEEQIRNLAAELLIGGREISPLWSEKNISVPDKESKEVIDRLISDTLLRFKLHKVNAYIKQVNEAIKTTTEPEAMMELVIKHKQFTLIRNKIAKQLHQVFSS